MVKNMDYIKIGDSGIKLSLIGLGGHEFLQDGSSRGFHEDLTRAVTPGQIFTGFGGEKRKHVLRAAFEYGINVLDVTIDSEKEALGRNLQEVVPPHEVYVQTRPAGMVYNYDKNNTRMARYDLLRAEVERILTLIRRERIDFFNVAFMKSALDNDPEYLEKIKENVNRLKEAGLIRFACADTFSGEWTYVKQIETGCFDVVYINFNFADCAAENRVLPLAKKNGMTVITREPFMKGALFHMGSEIGVDNKNLLAHISLKWNILHQHTDVVLIGVDNADQLRSNLSVLDNLQFTSTEQELLEKLKRSTAYNEYSKTKAAKFLEE